MSGHRGRAEGRQDEGYGPFYHSRQIYRARDGMIMGVMKGLARHFGYSVGWVRFFGVLILLFSGFWPAVIIYLAAGFLMKPEPVIPPQSADEEAFYGAYTGSRGMAIARLKERFERLDRRIRRMEDRVTSRDFDWEERLNRSGGKA